MKNLYIGGPSIPYSPRVRAVIDAMAVQPVESIFTRKALAVMPFHCQSIRCYFSLDGLPKLKMLMSVVTQI